jgi:flotillin
MVWYHVAEPNSYLVVTGVGIEKVLIKKKVNISHTAYTCNVC